MNADFLCPHCGAVNIARNVFCSFCSRSLIAVSPNILNKRYQILEKVGQGGFATVYKAKDLKLSKAQDPELAPALRAIKEIDDQQLSPQERQEAIDAFGQEVLMLASLMHPSLPRIYDHFEERQRWYLVMDYIEGETLEKILARSPQRKLPVEQVIKYALELCKVLKYLHTRKPPIIFRDLKPANIMITHEDHLYLIDFGIARFFKPGKGRDTTTLGSPGYAPPEQYGRAQTTPQADIYSFGATLHYMLSGRDPSDDPFNFPSLKFDPYDTIMQAMDKLITQMVAMKREQRPASIQAVEQALDAISVQHTCQPRQAQPIFPPKLPTNKASPATPLLPINPAGKQKWFFSTGAIVNSSPTVVNGTVYFGSYDGNLYALDAVSGLKKWSFPTGDPVFSSPAVINSVVYFGSRDKNIYAVSTASSKKFWSFLSRDVVHSSPFIFKNIAYIGSDDYNLYAINTATGQKIWVFPTGNRVLSSPTVADGVVYFGSYDGNLYALDAVSGLKKWSFATDDAVRSSPRVVNGIVYFGSSDHKFYALDASTGKLMWSFLTGDKVTSSPRVVNGIVYFGSYDGNLYALDTGYVRKIWSFPTGDKVRSSPRIVNGMVYCGSDDHNLYCLDATSGQKIWSFQTGDRVQSSPTVVNGIVYVGSGDGNLYAISA